MWMNALTAQRPATNKHSALTHPVAMNASARKDSLEMGLFVKVLYVTYKESESVCDREIERGREGGRGEGEKESGGGGREQGGERW